MSEGAGQPDTTARDASITCDPAPLPVQSYLEMLAAPTTEAGSGSAGCLALAMAFGCLEKAAALTFKHHPDRTALTGLMGQLARLRRQSLDAAADEATCFAEFTRESSATNAPVLAQAERTALSLTARAVELGEQLDALVDASGRGDLIAASALVQAAKIILESNSRESAATR
jgi:hypothetical protein